MKGRPKGLDEQGELFSAGAESASEEDSSDDKVNRRSGTFVDNVKLPVHRWFRYSAGFSAQWVEGVIKEFKPRLVLDPFAGSGTTLLAADSCGVHSVGFESHPFVSRVAEGKIGWDLDAGELQARTMELLSAVSGAPDAEVEAAPELIRKCYSPDALSELLGLRNALGNLRQGSSDKVHRAQWLALTGILRSTSFVGTAQWQYVLPNKRKAKTLPPLVAFRAKIEDMCADIEFMRKSGASSHAKLLLHDARLVSEDVAPGSVDLVITSPPYPNNYDYADATRLEMTFWGEVAGWSDLHQAVRQYIIRSCSQHTTADRAELSELLNDPAVSPIRGELSAVCDELDVVRRTKGGKKAYHTMVAAYFLDMARVFLALRTYCREGARLCFVVGDSAPYGVYVPAEKWLGTLALAAGFTDVSFEKLRDRNVKWKNRKHTVPLHEGRLWIRG